MRKWAKISKSVNKEGTTIRYCTPGCPVIIESRRRHIPHANGRPGTWDYTSYFVVNPVTNLEHELHSLTDAKDFAEQYIEAHREYFKEAGYDI